MYKLICVDLDGTLLSPDNSVSQENIQAIKNALDQNIDVAIVSGRPNCFTSRIIRRIDKRMGHITFNGAYYRVHGKTKSFPIKFEIIQEIAAIAKKYDVRVFFKNKNLAIVTKDDPHILDYDDYRNETEAKDLLDFHFNVDAYEYFKNHKMDVLKVFTWDENPTAFLGFKEEVKKLPDIRCYDYGDKCFFELSSIETSKGKAILQLAKDLSIEASEIVCIGDNYNDMSMFEIAGLSVAMGNANDDIKNYCDKTTLTNLESGVAYAINNYVLKGE